MFVDAVCELPESDWDKTSLCPDWTNRQVVGHMIAASTSSAPKFFRRLVAAGFKFDTLANKDIHNNIDGKSTTELIAALRSLTNSRHSPPGPTATWLGEAIVHSEDFFRSLGAGYLDHPVEHVVAVADFYKNSNLLIGSKSRVAGVTLAATDTDWSTGSGPTVSGPAIALVMAMTGRKAALDDLSGDGIEVLRSRE